MDKLTELQRRSLITSFYEKHQNKGKLFTVKHYQQEGIGKSTVYNILKQYGARSAVARRIRSGGKNKKNCPILEELQLSETT